MFYTYVFYSTGAGWMIIYLWLWGPSTRTMWSNMKGSFLVWRRASRDTNPDEPPPEEDDQVRLHDMCWAWFVERQLISSNEHLLKIICNVWLCPVSKLKLYSCGYTRGSQFQSSRPPALHILHVNTPDSDNQLVRSALHAWTVFRLTCSLLPEQGNPLKFTSFRNIHSWICAVLN